MKCFIPFVVQCSSFGCPAHHIGLNFESETLYILCLMFLARKKSENDRSNAGETDINCVKAFSTSSGGRYGNPKKF